MAEIVDIILTIVVTSLSTAFATAFVQYYRQKWSERKNIYRGFLKEVTQNIKFADHNLKKLKNKAKRLELLPFRDDFWNMSLSGYLLDLPSLLQKWLYEIYIKQYVIREKLMMLRTEAQTMGKGEKFWEEGMVKEAIQEIGDLKAKLEKAEVRLK